MSTCRKWIPKFALKYVFKEKKRIKVPNSFRLENWIFIQQTLWGACYLIQGPVRIPEAVTAQRESRASLWLAAEYFCQMHCFSLRPQCGTLIGNICTWYAGPPFITQEVTEWSGIFFLLSFLPQKRSFCLMVSILSLWIQAFFLF